MTDQDILLDPTRSRDKSKEISINFKWKKISRSSSCGEFFGLIFPLKKTLSLCPSRVRWFDSAVYLVHWITYQRRLWSHELWNHRCSSERAALSRERFITINRALLRQRHTLHCPYIATCYQRGGGGGGGGGGALVQPAQPSSGIHMRISQVSTGGRVQYVYGKESDVVNFLFTLCFCFLLQNLKFYCCKINLTVQVSFNVKFQIIIKSFEFEFYIVGDFPFIIVLSMITWRIEEKNLWKIESKFLMIYSF